MAQPSGTGYRCKRSDGMVVDSLSNARDSRDAACSATGSDAEDAGGLGFASSVAAA